MILLPWHLGEMQKEENRKPWQKWTAAMSSSLGGAGPWDRSGDIEKRTLLNAVLLYRRLFYSSPRFHVSCANDPENKQQATIQTNKLPWCFVLENLNVSSRSDHRHAAGDYPKEMVSNCICSWVSQSECDASESPEGQGRSWLEWNFVGSRT